MYTSSIILYTNRAVAAALTSVPAAALRRIVWYSIV